MRELVFVDLPEPKSRKAHTQSELSRCPEAFRKKYAHDIAKLSISQNRSLRPAVCPHCDNTGFKRMIAHHDDYTRPLRVTFMCATCHVKVHHPSKV